jgi:two-component system sensor histidine kinase PilS (NtrC family)
MHVLMFFLVGTVGGYLARRIKLKGRQLESTETELERLRIDTDHILNNMSSGILVIDSTGIIITMNPAAEDILDVDMADVLNFDLEEALGDRVPQLTSELRNALSEERSRFRHEILIQRRDHKETPVGMSISILRDEDGEKRGAISVFQDLTEVQEMRNQIRKADRLAAIGELSAGIAHELRNPLASISGSIEVLSNELNLAGENKRLMNLILRESGRLDRIISDFLEFAGLRTPRKRTVSITTCLDEVMVLVRNHPAMAKGIEIEFEHYAKEVCVNVDDEQLRQVFLNLAINSCEAMENGGVLRIVTGQEGPGQLRISFYDDGPGIEEEDVNRLFEPFFTTKERGTGLGLAIANRIVTAHGGVIAFNNRKNGGAEFNIVLPVGDRKLSMLPKTEGVAALV